MIQSVKVSNDAFYSYFSHSCSIAAIYDVGFERNEISEDDL
jgi:hypothetical protein